MEIGHGIPMEAVTGLLIIVVLGIVIFRLIKGRPDDNNDS